MKTLYSILLMLISFQVLSQNNAVTGISISLPANPDANTANWRTGTSMLTISATAKVVNGRPDVRTEDSRILVIVRKAGGSACGGHTSATAPAANFTSVSKVWSGNNAVALLGQDCTLPPGEYELCVQFFANGTRGMEPISEEKCKPFSIIGDAPQNYQPPQPLLPLNMYVFDEGGAGKPVTFRWTPVVPQPREPVIYRLRVWQLTQGQNAGQAIKASQPIHTKDVNNLTQAIIGNLATLPCLSPYLCEFAWNVQALNREGKPVGGNNGTSEMFRFSIGSDPGAVALQLVSPANNEIIKVAEPSFKWTIRPPADWDGDGYFKIRIIEIKGDESPEPAFRTNKPFFEKDSIRFLKGNKPHFEKDSPALFSFRYPVSAPKFVEGKTYAWQVQSLSRDGKPVGENNGNSEVWKFTVGNYAINVTDLAVGCGKNAVYAFSIKISNPNNATAIFDKLELVMVNGAAITPMNITTVSPATGTVIPANGSITVSGSFSYTGAVNTVCIKAYIKDQVRPLLNTASSYICDTLPCCDPCSFNKVEVTNNAASATGSNKITLTNTLSANATNVTKIKADLAYVKVKANSNNCNQCNNNREQQHHFTGNNTIVNGNGWSMNGTGTVPYNSTGGIARSLTFTSANAGGVNIGTGIKFNHTLGVSPVSCCGDEIEVWIRYTVWSKDCFVCDKLVKAVITRNKLCGDGGTDIETDDK